MNEVKVVCPATVANLVCGFDILGLCLNQPFDIMELRLLDRKAVIIKDGSGSQVPSDPNQNTAGAPLLEMINEMNRNIGFELTIHKNIRPGSGIGSSAASAAGSVVAANHLLGNIYSKQDLVRFAMVGEKVASGVKHADNIAPCIYGGITLIRSIYPLDIVSIPSPLLFVSIVHPEIEVRTADAREILRKQVLLKDAIKQWGNVGGLVAGLMKGDYDLISRSLEDYIIEPTRSILIPGFADIKKKCKEAGALGGGISGSGPSIFMLSTEERIARKVEGAMAEVFSQLGIGCNTYVSTINKKGVQIVQ